MVTLTNKKIVLTKRLSGIPDWRMFQLQTEYVSTPLTARNTVLIRILYVSIDPAMRGWMSDVESYIAPVQIGDVMRANAFGRVIASTHNKLAVNDVVTGLMGLQTFFLTSEVEKLQLIPVNTNLSIPNTAYLSVLGVTGLTAYFGLLHVGRPTAGECVLVSAAAGATGSIVGQIAKLKDCRVVGIAGSDVKCSWLVNELGFDESINYKTCSSLINEIKRTCPKGVDIFFDNVGGSILNDALSCSNRASRVVICGAISQYNSSEVVGPSQYLQLLVHGARMEGFVVLHYYSQFPIAYRHLTRWVTEGKLKWKDHVEQGLERSVEALGLLFRGENRGKLMVEIAKDEPPLKSLVLNTSNL